MSQPKNRAELLKALEEMTPHSGERWQQAQSVLPGGLSSGARIFEPYPFYTQRADGGYIWDIDGNRYYDCCMAYGALLLGHRAPVIVEALQGQLERSTIYGTPHELEVAFAEKFTQCAPCADKVLLCNSGTEATMQGIRIARAFTGKDKLAKFECGYHGWHDYAMWSSTITPELMGPEDRPDLVADSAGIPKAVKDTMLLLPFNENAFNLIEENADELAGVIIEPVIGEGTHPLEKSFLEGLREVTKSNDVILIFDEVITGFRLALGGAQELFGVIPDIATYGKTIGGGMPVGAVGGPNEIIDAVTKSDPHISVAGTYSGNPMTLAAGNAMIGYLMENPNVYEDMKSKGDRIRAEFNEFARAENLPGTMAGIGSLFQTHIQHPPVTRPRQALEQDHEALRDFQLYLRYNGVFIPRVHLGIVSPAHSEEDVGEIIKAHQRSLEACVAAQEVI
jgi:glutamate-1-semialdehyde 2,1-aminomutase